MKDNARTIFSLLWLVMNGILLGCMLAVIVSGGDYLDYLLAAAIAWAFITAGAIITSL